MPTIISIADVVPPFAVEQDKVTDFARDLFRDSFKDIERLLRAFRNGQIEKRHFVKELDWYKVDRSFTWKVLEYQDYCVTKCKSYSQRTVSFH